MVFSPPKRYRFSSGQMHRDANSTMAIDIQITKADAIVNMAYFPNSTIKIVETLRNDSLNTIHF